VFDFVEADALTDRLGLRFAQAVAMAIELLEQRLGVAVGSGNQVLVRLAGTSRLTPVWVKVSSRARRRK
jgi:hypothetical protein